MQAPALKLTMTEKERLLPKLAEDGWLAGVPGKQGHYSIGVSAAQIVLCVSITSSQVLYMLHENLYAVSTLLKVEVTTACECRDPALQCRSKTQMLPVHSCLCAAKAKLDSSARRLSFKTIKPHVPRKFQLWLLADMGQGCATCLTLLRLLRPLSSHNCMLCFQKSGCGGCRPASAWLCR